MSHFDPKTAFSLSGQSAVVTGGGRGIVRGVALGLARAGATLHIFDRDQSAADETVSLLKSEGHQAQAYRVDVSDEVEIEAAMKAVASHGAIDLLINNVVVAQGEVVLVNERYGIRLTRVVSAAQRIKNL